MHDRFPEPTHLKNFKWRGFFLFILVTLVCASLLAIVHVQHKIRNIESRYYQSLQQSLVAKEEWGRLMLEKKHLTSPKMVEQIAKQQLGMTLDKEHFQYLYVEPTFPNVENINNQTEEAEQVEH